MKKLLGCDLSGLGLLASANLTLSGIAELVTGIEPILRVLLSIGQLAVATATVWYIVRKARAVK